MAYDADGNWTPDSGDSYGDSYTYATPEELTGSGYSAPNSGIDYANTQDLANSGYLSYADPSELDASGYTAPMSGQYSTGSYAPNAPTLADFLKSLGAKGAAALTKAASDPAGLAKLAQQVLAARALLNPSTGQATQNVGYNGPGINMAMTANRSPVAIPEYVPYAGKGAKGMDYGVNKVTYAAEGGIMGLAHGGRYLDGATDGMADKIDTSIDDKHPAKLSHGEFVIPADVVSHLGNGNSTAGADVLYKMMERVRKARTGNPKQGKEIKPEKFTPGGIANYAGGGAVAFVTGGLTSGASLGDAQNLSTWAGPYVTDMLSKTNALANTPTPTYTGQLTAGQSPLQSQAFTAGAGLPGALGPVGSVQSYMNPYMQGAVNVQNDEARRQADITRMNNAGRLVGAGAFGGSRQAIMESEGDRNLATLQNQNQATGMNTAYNNAVQQQGNVAKYNVDATNAAATLGGQQRTIEQQGIDAQKAQFEQQAADPYKRLQFQQSMLKDLPISTSTGTTNYSSLDNLSNLINQLVGGAK